MQANIHNPNDFHRLIFQDDFHFDGFSSPFPAFKENFSYFAQFFHHDRHP